MSSQESSRVRSGMLRFWGVRGSVPTPGPSTIRYGGNTSCVEVRLGDEVIILDAGTGIRLLGDALVRESAGTNLEVSLLISHSHWDHIQGLPFFAPAYQVGNGVRIYGCEGARQGLHWILSRQMEQPHFPIPMREMVSEITITELKEAEFSLGQIHVASLALNHPGGSTGYRLSYDGQSVVYLPDNEPASYGLLGSPDAPAATELGDLNREIIEFIRGADVAVMDAQYDALEYRDHVGWGHGCVDDVVRIAVAGKVQRLFLFHHDPDHDDDRVDQMVLRARELVQALGSDLVVDAAKEGLTVPVALRLAEC